MEKQTHFFENTDHVDLIQVGNDQCVLSTPDYRMILSHDAALDLATRLAYIIAKMEAESDLCLCQDGFH